MLVGFPTLLEALQISTCHLVPKPMPCFRLLRLHKILGTKICLNYHLLHHISPQILNLLDSRQSLPWPCCLTETDYVLSNQGINDSGQYSYHHSCPLVFRHEEPTWLWLYCLSNSLGTKTSNSLNLRWGRGGCTGIKKFLVQALYFWAELY